MAVSSLSYRPDIDGMRGLAVLSVVLFHLNGHWLPGGFVGVDIFFVISGYLISSIIYRDCQKGTLSFARFYQRRIARIFPVCFTVGFATVGVAAIVYLPQDFASAGANFVASALSVTNLKLIFQGSYFEISSDAQPFLHYWSLSVEEQFYLVFPALLFVTYRYSRSLVPKLIGVAVLFSLGLCIVLTELRPTLAFYLLPTRAWELLVGAWIATSSPALFQSRYVPFLRWVGLALVAFSLLFVREGRAFPGWQALFPVLGTGLLILPNAGGVVQRFLAFPLLVRIGKISFSLYLWHWPVFSFVDYQFLSSSGATRIVLKLSATVFLSVVCYLLIENPARVLLNKPRRRALSFGLAAILVTVSVALGFSVRRDNYISADLDQIRAGGVRFPGPGPSVVLMGDSNGSMYALMMKKLAQERGIDLTVISVAAGNPLPHAGGDSPLWNASFELVKRLTPQVLLFGCSWKGKLSKSRSSLSSALAKLRPYTGQIVLLNQPPVLPKESSRVALRAGVRPPFEEDATDRVSREDANRYLLTLRSDHVQVIDVESLFKYPGGDKIRFFDDRGRQLYHDPTHLSLFGAEEVRPAIERILDHQLEVTAPRL